MIKLNQESLRDLNTAASREWLETNGIGGFSSSTVIGLNTRRYHGLLTAATKPPVGRLVLLSKLEETLVIDGRRYELSANQYPGVVHPQGFNYQIGFRLDPFPIFTYEVEGVRLEKSVFMVQRENSTVVQYRIVDTTHRAKLEIRPLIAFRDYHSTTHENAALNQQVQIEEGLVTVTPYSDLPALYLAHTASEVDTNGFWFRNFQYVVEQERGLDFVEDLFSPCALICDLDSTGKATVIASTRAHDVRQVDEYRDSEIERRRVRGTPSASETINALATAVDQFIVARDEAKTVIAGYHWFADWGRDTMIALPGLTLATGRPEIAKSILHEFAKHVDRGMLPNRFPDAGETPEYNTVDATLWYFEAVRSLLQHTNDYEFVRANLYDVLKEIIEWHVKGTRYGIRVDDDGLLASGESGVQLTWMDAKVGDWVVTPRHGKPVEIQALWYNALRVMEHLAEEFNEPDAAEYGAMADHARASFNEQFWNEQSKCLHDVVNGEMRDASIRPNQVFAISLANTMLSKERAASVLHVVERELLTPRGLRTLSPADPNYIRRYEGGPASRDGAYHQGTVWPWLMGPYITAYVKTFDEIAGREFAASWLENFHEHLHEACLGQVSEIFDGDAPHRPRGCVAQAWSVAEILRAVVEDVNLTVVSNRASACT